MEIPEQIWLLIARNLSGEASEAEQKDLAEILRNDEQLQQHYDLLTRVWVDRQISIQYDEGLSANSTVTRIIHKASNISSVSEDDVITPVLKPRRSRWKVWIAAASVFAVISVAGLWLLNNRDDTLQPKTPTFEAHRGSRIQSVLRDGTIVWLNAGSKLYYENDFTGATREVKLDGEAFFDVVKKTDQPFIVHAYGIDIKVLGTSFNVKSYPEDKTVETTLYRGLVKVFRHEESEKKAIQLKPNEKVALVKEAAVKEENLSALKTSPGKEIEAGPAILHIDSTKKEDQRIETAWVYNRLEFDKTSFEDVAKQLERWYNITIEFTDEKVKQLSVHGSFEKETVQQAFMALKEGFPITYKIDDDRIYVGSAN